MNVRRKTFPKILIIVLLFCFLMVYNIQSLWDAINNYDEKVKYKTDSPKKYKQTILKRWLPAPFVPEVTGIGEMGKPAYVHHQENEFVEKQYKTYQYNVLVSDAISLKRSLPDVRSHECKLKKYSDFLPTTSVIIVFHNEAWSTLLRTVWSVINRSPKSLLREIILVDDASEQKHLGKRLENYVSKLPTRVHVFRTGKRSGLVKSRLLGVKHMKGKIITFLDPHCECTQGWLEPLLNRISENRTIVASPVIDYISKDTFEYTASFYRNYGGFDWYLSFQWYDFKREYHDGNKSVPIKTPVISGIFSIDKKYFLEMGSYDEGMDGWGMEYLEMSFRLWQCGGTLEIVPCSRVGHVFKNQFPYVFPGDISRVIYRNANRAAQVWMDQWSHFYYAMNPVARLEPAGNISARIDLRKKLKCKSFQWYLENIYPESSMPLQYFYLGAIRNLETQHCLDIIGRKENENVAIYNCHHLGSTQLFVYTKRYQIMSNGYCLDASLNKGPVQLIICQANSKRQVWKYNLDDKTITHRLTGSCLTKPDSNAPYVPLLKACNKGKGQQWLTLHHFRWQVGQID